MTAPAELTGVVVRPDIEYASPQGVPLFLDLYLPADAPARAACVYLHGGGWLRGSRKDRAVERLVPLARSGIAVAAVQYRLSGQAIFPAQLDDGRAAVRWLRRQGGELDIASQDVAVWGASAGGHLAALLGLCPDPEDAVLGDSSVQAVVAWFPTTDLLARDTDEPEGPPPPWLVGPLPSPSFEARLLGLARTRDDPARARAASPVTHAHTHAPPFLLMHGDRDGVIPSSHSRKMADGLRAHGVPTSLLLLYGANHEDPAFESPTSIGAVTGFLTTALSR